MADSESSYTEIVVVRHGETDWNHCGRIQGQADVELNEVGIQQAAVVADRLSKERKVSAVYSSDLMRALKTAEMIAASCGGMEVTKDLGLRERNVGDLQGLVFREAAKVSPVAYKALLSHKTDQEIPGGGETVDQLYNRCTLAVEKISENHIGERVIVVTHGGVIRELYKRACPNGSCPGKIYNTSVTIFHLYDGDKWILKSWCDLSHLNPTGYLDSGFGGDKNSA